MLIEITTTEGKIIMIYLVIRTLRIFLISKMNKMINRKFLMIH